MDRFIDLGYTAKDIYKGYIAAEIKPDNEV